MLRQPQRHFSLAEYFDIEAHSSIKHEYCNGEIFAMAGASLRHNRITGNLYAYLHVALRGKGCTPFGSDLRIATPSGLYTYPDISIICGEVQLTDDPSESARNPVVLVEVLSDATRDYDRGDKFALYQSIPSFQEYVLIEQDRVGVECLRKQPDGSWISSLCTAPDSVLTLASVQLSISCVEIYHEVVRR